MSNPTTAAPATNRPGDPLAGDGMQAMRAGFELARASQLTMLRLQLALHKSNRRNAIQALDDLLDLDAEMECVAATLAGTPARVLDDAALSGFIGLQRAAIAAEKHVLMGSDGRGEARPIPIAPPEDRVSADAAPPPLPDDVIESAVSAGAGLPLPLSDDEVETEEQAGSRSGRWILVLAIVIALALIGGGVAAYLQPEWRAMLNGIPAQVRVLVSGF